MYGYIYLTTNLLNNRMYIGKHKSDKYDKSYYGSGKILLQAIAKYGIDNFKNEILYIANDEDELNNKEIEYIDFYRNKFGKLLYNIAIGGNGGDTFSNKTENEKEAFVKTMTNINRKRCNSSEFRNKASLRMKKRYSNESERNKQSEKIKRSWSNQQLREEQSSRLKEYYKNHKKNQSYLYKECILEIDGQYFEFENFKSLRKFLKEHYNYKPDYNMLKEIIRNSKNDIGFNPYHKNKLKDLVGMKIFYKQSENVETMGDECSPVEDEIGTSSKRKTEIEEIVHSA